jgi:hypothetical protein
MRGCVVPVCFAVVAVVAGCGGGSGSGSGSTTTRQQQPAAPSSAQGDPIKRVAVAATVVANPAECPRWYEGRNGMRICQTYVSAGSLQSGAAAGSVTRTGEKAAVNMRKKGGNPFALLLRRKGGKWRVYDAANFLPVAGP